MEEQSYSGIVYSIIEQPRIRAVGYRFPVRGKTEERQGKVALFWKEMEEDGRLASLRALESGAPVLGVSMNFLKDGFDFCVCVESEQTPPEGMEEVEVKSDTYAVFSCESSSPEAVQQRWSDLYAKWFFRSGYGHRGTAEVEVYKEHEASVPCELRAPVKKFEMSKARRGGTQARDLFVVMVSVLVFLYIGASLNLSTLATFAFAIAGLLLGVGVNRYLKQRAERKAAEKEKQEENGECEEE